MDDRGQEVYEAIQEAARNQRVRALSLAELLVEAHDNRYWEGRAESWPEFLASPEVNIRPPLARQLMRIHRTYVIDLGFETDYLQEYAPDTLDRLHKHLKDATREKAENLLEQAAVLGQADVKVLCRELAGGQAVEADKIEWAVTKYNRCVAEIRDKLTAEEMIGLREHPDRVPL